MKNGDCINGGTYDACIKAQEVVKNYFDGGYKLVSLTNKVSIAEFVEAVKILMTFASKHPDEYVEICYCETDCVRSPNPDCPYRQFTFSNGTAICPHYIEEDK